MPASRPPLVKLVTHPYSPQGRSRSSVKQTPDSSGDDQPGQRIRGETVAHLLGPLLKKAAWNGLGQHDRARPHEKQTQTAAIAAPAAAPATEPMA